MENRFFNSLDEYITGITGEIIINDNGKYIKEKTGIELEASAVEEYRILFEEVIIDNKTKETLEQQKAEALKYLADTDWVEAYKIRHDLGLALIPEDSSKWEILNKREEYKLFLKGDK